MILELVVNGLEAAVHAAPGGRQMVIAPRTFEGLRKRRIWNIGPSLNVAELLQITDLASPLRKQNSLNENFGTGAKVASLASNQHGLRYRSCTGARVSEVVMGYRDGIYGRLYVGAKHSEVCHSEGGYDLSLDWTDVLLCGGSAEQNTVVAPYGASLKATPDWIGAHLEKRLFRLPHNVSLTLMPAIWAGAAPRPVVGLDDRREEFGHTEIRVTPNGVKIHYFYDPPEGESTKSAKGAIAAGTSREAIVFRDEMYDVRGASAWLWDAPKYGTPFGAKYVSIFVELPRDYFVCLEAYRQFLRFRDNDQRQVYLSKFSPLVRGHTPDWLAEIVRSFGPGQANYLDDISDELKALLASLVAQPQSQPPMPGLPVPPKAPAAEVKPKPAEPTAEKFQQPPVPPKPELPTVKRPPETIDLRTPEQPKERALEGRAGKFYPQSHQIFINLAYSSMKDMAGALLAGTDIPLGAHEEEARRIATETAEWALTKRISRAVVYSLSKKMLGWRPEEVSRSQSTESLSLLVDDRAFAMEMARIRYHNQLPPKLPALMAA